MVEFKNKEEIKGWLVDMENQITLLKANLVCEERKCMVVKSSTSGFVYRSDALSNLKSIKDCADMVSRYLADDKPPKPCEPPIVREKL